MVPTKIPSVEGSRYTDSAKSSCSTTSGVFSLKYCERRASIFCGFFSGFVCFHLHSYFSRLLASHYLLFLVLSWIPFFLFTQFLPLLFYHSLRSLSLSILSSVSLLLSRLSIPFLFSDVSPSLLFLTFYLQSLPFWGSHSLSSALSPVLFALLFSTEFHPNKAKSTENAVAETHWSDNLFDGWLCASAFSIVPLASVKWQEGK